jgi:hypothetical protein
MAAHAVLTSLHSPSPLMLITVDACQGRRPSVLQADVRTDGSRGSRIYQSFQSETSCMHGSCRTHLRSPTSCRTHLRSPTSCRTHLRSPTSCRTPLRSPTSCRIPLRPPPPPPLQDKRRACVSSPYKLTTASALPFCRTPTRIGLCVPCCCEGASC